MKKLAFAAIIPALMLTACGSSEEQKVYGPEDYKHFSDFFTMNESAANEMGAAPTGVMDAAKEDQMTSILTSTNAGVDPESSASVAAQ